MLKALAPERTTFCSVKHEGMAFSPDRQTLDPMLEGTVLGDSEGALRIYKFDVASSAFEGLVGLYQMDAANHAIGKA